ncbi:MAG TPA: response regulator transcription factor [Chthoniobacteraceae bacterium]|jgi:DNA-binding NarL/FixJ family response regulator|nr:response regulator transcription factor [Chthoniobacteraceae bacterium]
MESKTLSVLIADDETTVLEALTTVLTRLGYNVVGTARDGAEIVDLVRTTPADFLVLDISMPVMDGLEAARVIAAEKPLPIIISTGVTDDVTIEAARKVPVQAFLTKPFRKEQLRASIAIALTQWEHQREAERKLQSLLEAGSGAVVSAVPRISEEAARQFGLTKREYEVLCRIAEGKSNAEIGEAIGAATRTVDKHVEHIFDKLAVKTRTAAVARALHMEAA